jgi:hypothetical protein
MFISLDFYQATQVELYAFILTGQREITIRFSGHFFSLTGGTTALN